MKNKTQKLAGFILLLAISLYSFPIYALTKDETVYGKLNSDGSVKKVFVNNQLINNNNDKEITDETDLLNILNINGKEKFTQDGNKLTWEYNGKDIYYKGETTKELPIKLEIKYYQNNEEKELNSILGQSGNFKIQILYTNLDKHSVNGEYLYTPFLVTTGLIVKGNNNKNIIVNNGKVINNGTDNIVVGLSAPGLYESLKIDELKTLNEITIEFESTKFELPNIYSIITPKLIEENDLKIFDKMDELYKNVDTLKSGIDTIESGTTTLENGAQELYNGSIGIQNGINEIKNNLGTIVNGSKQINTGLTGLYEVLNPNSNASTNQALNLPQFKDTKEVLDELHQTIDKIPTVIANNQNTINGIKTLLENPNLPEEQRQGMTELIKGLETYNAIFTTLLPSTITTLKTGSETLNNGLNTLYNGVELLSSKTNEFVAGTNTLYEGTKTLHTGVTKFNEEGITPIYNITNTKVKTLSTRLKTLVKLSENYNTFTMKSDETESSTKFVLSIDGVKQTEQKQVTKKEKEKESLWTKIKNLFK